MRLHLLALLLVSVLLANLQTVKAQKVVLHMTGRQTFECNISQLDSITFVDAEKHEWVDLGLPSGTLWATCNIGANSPEKSGDYFAWGETSPKKSYYWNTYKHCTGSYNTMTKYCTKSDYGYKAFTDNLTELMQEDDAATTYLGNKWQIPSQNDYKELINSDYTMTEWTTKEGVNGCKITSKINNNSIFLPAADYRQGTSISYANYQGYYWTRTLSSLFDDSAYYLYFTSDYYSDDINTGKIGIGTMDRFHGLSIRPIRVKTY